MNTNDATRANAPALSEIHDALDVINRAWSLVELINMAAEACNVTGAAGNAIAWGCISAQEQLDQAKKLLRADEEDGARDLTQMLTAYNAIHGKITSSEDDTTADEDGEALVAAALRIISYRPQTHTDRCRKAKFLEEYTHGALFTEVEQNALVASLMPEGGAA